MMNEDVLLQSDELVLLCSGMLSVLQPYEMM